MTDKDLKEIEDRLGTLGPLPYGVIRDVTTLIAEVKRLREYEWMYKELQS